MKKKQIHTEGAECVEALQCVELKERLTLMIIVAMQYLACLPGNVIRCAFCFRGSVASQVLIWHACTGAPPGGSQCVGYCNAGVHMKHAALCLILDR